MPNRIILWAQRHLPTREQLERNRFIRPFAHRVLRSDLWRFTRRSVPRGVALGLFVGVMIPLAHFVVAAFLAVFVRANIPAALAATFIGFPVVYVFIVALAYRIGEWLLHLDAATTMQPISGTMQATQTGDLLQRITGAGMQTAFGLLVIATVLAVVGYLATGFFWRLRIAAKRRHRLAEARARRAAAVA
ncbi:MAG: DUF2062 domain-containing protein [Croceibacterium sp.]